MLHIFLSVLLMFYLSPIICVENTTSDQDSYYPVQDWSDAFDWKLLKAFSSKDNRNVIISPIALKLVLALLYEGSTGGTEKEFQAVLQFSPQKDVLREKYRKILESLQPSEREQYILNLGTRIFLDSSITPQPNFQTKAQEHYRTDIEPANFSQPQEASVTINSWIDKLTNGRVPELVSANDLQNAIMLIGNAIFFKGTWRHQFPKNNTKTGGFYVSPDEIVQVQYMSTTDQFYYFESNELNAQILRLPYKGNYAMFIVLPNAQAGLPELLKKINLTILKQQLYFLDQVPVNVRIPKFKFQFQARYNKILQDFGLKQMFQDTAGFSSIAKGFPNLQRRLVVSDIVQKSGMELDEEGSVVYAATEVQVGNKFGEVDNVFNATRPFMFFIEEQTTATILFVGKVENPLDMTGLPLPSRFGGDDEVESGDDAQIPDLEPSNPESDAILSRFNYFDLELLTAFSETNGNVFISPASIKTTLALILEGAGGKCADEIGNALRIKNIDQPNIREILTRLLFDLTDRSPNTVLESANSIFVSDKYQVYPEYQKKVATYYKAPVTKLDFTNAAESTKVINNWVTDATRGLITEIVGPQNFNPDTSVILTNALFFKGKWKNSFDVNNTKPRCFQSPTRKCVTVPLMQISDTFNYNFNVHLDAHTVELPYQDDRYAMLLLLPSDGNNIKTLARDMQHARLTTILDLLRPAEIILEMPRFEIDYSADLVQFLKHLKIQEIFGDRANLSRLISQESVRISNIVHKTKIEVNEQGTRAAAATSALVIPLMGSTAQKVVADHPFIFFIYHKETRNIIFEGVYKEPPQNSTTESPALLQGTKLAERYYFPIRKNQQKFNN